MRSRSPRRVAMSLAALGAMGCGTTGIVESGPDLENGDTVAEVPAGATAVTYNEVTEATSTTSAIQSPERGIITNAPDWQAYWTRFVGSVTPQPPAPTVDFGAERVVTAAMGSRGTGGHAINVTEVRGDADAIYVVVLETTPGPSCFVTQATTAPAVAVRVPADNRPVTFVEEARVLDC
ncbi:MAG: protease complex subunit PrcB family protein [Gemmatimonadota bacterium]|nr:protease complex subunit PrcB family protein [Gemmatimonadota bacterium]